MSAQHRRRQGGRGGASRGARRRGGAHDRAAATRRRHSRWSSAATTRRRRSTCATRAARRSVPGSGSRSTGRRRRAPPAELVDLVRSARRRRRASTASSCSCRCPGTSTPTRSPHASRPEKDADGFHPYNFGRLAEGHPAGSSPGHAARLHGAAAAQRRADPRQPGRGHRPQRHRRAPDRAAAHQRGRDGHHLPLPNAATSRRSAARRTSWWRRSAGRAWSTPRTSSRARSSSTSARRRRTACVVGDVDRASVEPVAGWLTPVPGGVGPMTIAMLPAQHAGAGARAPRARAGLSDAVAACSLERVRRRASPTRARSWSPSSPTTAPTSAASRSTAPISSTTRSSRQPCSRLPASSSSTPPSRRPPIRSAPGWTASPGCIPALGEITVHAALDVRRHQGRVFRLVISARRRTARRSSMRAGAPRVPGAAGGARPPDGLPVSRRRDRGRRGRRRPATSLDGGAPPARQPSGSRARR